ncbi:MAG: tRNA (N6-isopentenyl adenosine(37)-C2)-methylthiotransferase MiaB [Candidatus Omnitrophica bacterium CG1_02_49_10]|nr:MAG: tRNA (N6-isopentenyl adenosine(37)-C2)-methylthiotransferase MiaB [Candidatus Omnitrophica bacterium CG1_02_49_10]
MNNRDSEMVTAMLEKKGFESVRTIGEADIVIFNTCSVRKQAEERVFSELSKVSRLKRERPEIVLALIGCMAYNYKSNIYNRLPELDLVCGPSDIYGIADYILNIIKNKSRILAVDKESREDRPEAEFFTESDDSLRFVSIMHGCDNFCSYCIVPYVRGREVSRSPEHIIGEIKRLAADGAKNVMLLGQNVNSYGKGLSGIDFVGLLETINGINGIENVSFMTSHPKDAGEKLFKAMRDLKTLSKRIHLPLQSGSDRILRLMNRRYTFSDYAAKIERLRALVPDCEVTTDMIVGFPTESDEDFTDSVKAMEKIGFDDAYIFKYSPRKGTKASEFEDDVPAGVKLERNHKLLSIQSETRKRKGIAK